MDPDRLGAVPLLLLALSAVGGAPDGDLLLLKTVRTDYLQHYEGYAYVAVVRLAVPDGAQFAAFRFRAEQTSFSIFGCDRDEVIVYVGRGSIPAVNADGSRAPPDFYNASGAEPPMRAAFSSDGRHHYLNVTEPAPGAYYAAAFHPHRDPDGEGITQSGLSKVCQTYVDASLYVRRPPAVAVGASGAPIAVALRGGEPRTYRFLAAAGDDRAVVSVRSVRFCPGCSGLTATLRSDGAPLRRSITVVNATYRNETVRCRMDAAAGSWHYVRLRFDGAPTNNSSSEGHLELRVASFASSGGEEARRRYSEAFATDDLERLFGDATYRSSSDEAPSSMHREYELARSGKAESFSYQFDLRPRRDGSVPIALNLTGRDYITLKFSLSEAIDTGGTLSVVVAFAPRVSRFATRAPEPPGHTVTACIASGESAGAPKTPGKCGGDDAPLVLNATTTNATASIAYPAAGGWSVTLSLDCGVERRCEPCRCPRPCVDAYQNCVNSCEETCEADGCERCGAGCRKGRLEGVECAAECDCEAGCRRGEGGGEAPSCNATVLFDVASYPCVPGGCGRNGRCVFMVSEGIVYSTCLCSNNYRGWDCGDDTHATPPSLIALETALLVASNAGFAPAACVAWRRGHASAAVAYAAALASSALYHACDAAGLCAARLGVLQFADFYAGLLALWVTLVAMAWLPRRAAEALRAAGGVALATATALDRTSVWAFAAPAAVGAATVAASWAWRARRTRAVFPSKRYLARRLPAGLAAAAAGFVAYALLQTRSNYKYVHSAWHLLVAAGAVLLLPEAETFLPEGDAERGPE